MSEVEILSVEEEPRRGIGQPYYSKGKTEVYVGGRVPVKVTVKAPNGRPLELTYGAVDYRGTPADTFRGRYRGEDVYGSTWARVQADLVKIEEKHQAKVAAKKVRDALSETPDEAVLFRSGNGEAEEVGVRGLDARVKRGVSLLVIRADGTRESVAAPMILRALSPEDLADLRALVARVKHAKAAVPGTTSAGDVIAKVLDGPLALDVRLDPETLERTAEYDGVTYRGEDDRDVLGKVIAALVRPTHPYQETGHRSRKVQPLGESVASHTTVWATEADAAAQAAAEAEVEAAEASLQAAQDEYAYDYSHLLDPGDKPEPDADTGADEGDGDAAHVPTDVTAPDHEPDW